MESLIALGALIGLAFFCVLVSAGISALKRRKKKEPPRRLLVHSINDDRCTGCDACVSVCPTDVLELIGNKSRVQRFDDCIQCEQCALVCPTTALVMHPVGTTPPAYRVPHLDDFYQAAPGLYLIGEAAGKPLVKNASNLGRVVVEHMLSTGLRSAPRRDGEVDVFIVGSGPGGLSAALSCVQRVVLSVGTRGKPRRLGVPGEHLPKVSPLLDDAATHRGQRVLVVGGGDSAVEAAVALAEASARVTLSYRGKALSRCKAKNRQALGDAVASGRIDLKFSSHVVEIKEHSVALRIGEKQEEIGNDHVFVCIGGDAPVKWMESVGVRFVEQPHMFQRGPTDKLVENLIGQVAETTREGAGGGAGAAVMVEPSFDDQQRTVLRFPGEKVRKIA
jgi:thioredoxin reductase/NAD-dependent dihydropyrimidine dehydrogenase PreA subunit